MGKNSRFAAKKTNSNGRQQKRYSYTSMEITASMQPILLYNMQPYIYTHVRTSIEYHTKNIVLKNAKTLAISKYCRIFAAQTNNNKQKLTIMKTNKTNRANSAKETAKKVNNRRTAAAAEKAVAVVDVETVNAAELPVVTESNNGKVSSKDVLKAAGSLRAAVKEERRGANVTIRLIAERAAAGDAAAVDVLCALCDVPRAALYSLNIDTVRAAVNAYYPYFVETDGRKVSVKPVGVWYSTKNGDEEIESAAKRVQRGYSAVAVVDYLDQLIKAAKSRAKGITPRCIDNNAIYSDIALSETAEGVTCNEIDEAKQRKAYVAGAVNVWHKHSLLGFYI